MPINKAQLKSMDRTVNFKLLKAQSETLSRIQLRYEKHGPPGEAKNLLGLWNMVGFILDDLETGGECVLEKM